MLKGSLAYIWKLPVAIFLIFCFPYLMTAQTTQPQTAELNILFPAGSVAIDMNYMGNAQRWEAFERAFRTNYGGKSKANLEVNPESWTQLKGSNEKGI